MKPIKYITDDTLDMVFLLIWMLVASHGLLNAYAVVCGDPLGHIVQSQSLGDKRQSGDNSRVQRWLEILTDSDYTFENRTVSPDANAYFLPPMPNAAAEHDGSRLTSLTPFED